MPIYEYVCLDCGSHFDLLRSMKDADAPAPCGACASIYTTRHLAVTFAAHGGGRSAAPGGAGNGAAASGCGSCSASSCAGCRK